MLLVIVRLIYAFVCAGVFASYVSNSAEDGIQVVPTIIATYPWQAFLVLMAITQVITLGDILIPRKKLDMISAVYFGLLIGIFLSYLLNLALDPIVGVGTWAPLVRWMTFLILPYVC
ncbi:MAG: PIN/TRAM domain-containing protein, partial [Planctomycetaceae bacterium]|nr:PIN/TRAM domain-containing protein [Planctomycetaceae bacterium]